ncbi:MAG: sigma-70 family RNA polymerase sigma factor [Akkermansia sp.]|nr:sigma-70 family RNA polymerase sigma factor [Akkermansia sp.]
MQQEKQHSDDARDKELMLLLCREKSEQAMRELIERHQKAVYSFAYRMMSNAADAEDITQRTFIRVWKAASSYEADAQFTTWLFTIAKHLVFNESRRRMRKPSVSLDEHEENAPALLQETAASSSPQETLLQRELSAQVDKALAGLPEKARMAVQLRRFQELSYEEIAHILDTSVSATKSLLFRARQQLKEALSRYL